MSSLVIKLEDGAGLGPDVIGGKGAALARMIAAGIAVPSGVCIVRDAYDRYVDSTGLRARIMYELNRKRFADMRWEEMWDAALRIRSMFLATAIPSELEADLALPLADAIGDRPVVVRSSAPAEDTAATSFAGLHESYVNVRGSEQMLKHVRLVWASLWSDAALLYRRELGLDVEHSAMAVVIQTIAVGEKSGVAFCRNPANSSQAVIEAVHGLNQGLVDGTVEPDRWIIARGRGEIVEHMPAQRETAVRPSADGTVLAPLEPELRAVPPLAVNEVERVYGLAVNAEALFAAPQDVEWTFAAADLLCLQSRAITTASQADADDERSWYLSLRPGFEKLQTLRDKIESQILPGMAAEAEKLGETDFRALDDEALADEIARIKARHDHWLGVYWSDLIPFAHGVRLFGQFYNDAVTPDDPYEFVELLSGGSMQSTDRNRLLLQMAELIRSHGSSAPEPEELDTLPELSALVEEYLDRFGDVMKETIDRTAGRRLVLGLAARMAQSHDAPARSPREPERLRPRFLDRFSGTERAFAESVLDLAQASYRIRDDDNLYLAKVEAPLTEAVNEAIERLGSRPGSGRVRVAVGVDPEQVARALRDPGFIPEAPGGHDDRGGGRRPAARQIVGQPAGPGLASGVARVITHSSQLFDFREGEVLVCDAVQPDMTLIVPLAAGIVERRGGMLIHGAIIAREYGIACVTGVPDATELIATGDRVTVDGHLGIVIIDRATSAAS